MTEQTETMADIVEETIAAGTESGRTACGRATNVKGPLARFPAAVDLRQCPLSVGGAWHTHTIDLVAPENSLPDVANVVFGDLDASVVVGSQTSDVFVRADDRAAMADAFRDAVGMDARSTQDVVQAIEDGRISDPPAARSRVRKRMAPLFRRPSTPLPIDPPRAPTAREPARPDTTLYHSGPAHASHPAGRASQHAHREFQAKARERTATVADLGRSVARTASQVAVAGVVRRAMF